MYLYSYVYCVCVCVYINIYIHAVKLYLLLRVCWIPEIYIHIHRELKIVKMLLI